MIAGSLGTGPLVDSGAATGPQRPEATLEAGRTRGARRVLPAAGRPARPSRHARRRRDGRSARRAATSSASTSSSAARTARSTTCIVAMPPGGLADRLITGAQRCPGWSSSRCGRTTAARTCTATSSWSTSSPPRPAAGWSCSSRTPPGCSAPAGRCSCRPGPTRRSRRAPARPTSAAWRCRGCRWRAAARLDHRESWVPERWRRAGTELAAAPVGSPGRAVLVGRPGGPRFRASEVLRLTHLAGIAADVVAADGRRSGSGPPALAVPCSRASSHGVSRSAGAARDRYQPCRRRTPGPAAGPTSRASSTPSATTRIPRPAREVDDARTIAASRGSSSMRCTKERSTLISRPAAGAGGRGSSSRCRSRRGTG